MTDEDLDQPIGIWRAVGEFKLKDAVWPEGAIAVVVGGGVAALAVRSTTVADRADTANAMLALGGALLAVVFAALAIIVSISSNSYLRMLSETRDGGMWRFLRPFLIATGTQILIILVSIAYSLLATSAPWWMEHLAFYLLGFLVVFGLLDIAALARVLVRHGILRAADASIAEDEAAQKANVRALPPAGNNR